MDRTITLTVEDDEFGEDFDVRVSLDDIRTALEKHAPGWSLHRLDDCQSVQVAADEVVGPFVAYPSGTVEPREGLADGTYALVPVESGETE